MARHILLVERLKHRNMNRRLTDDNVHVVYKGWQRTRNSTEITNIVTRAFGNSDWTIANENVTDVMEAYKALADSWVTSPDNKCISITKFAKQNIAYSTPNNQQCYVTPWYVTSAVLT